MRVALPLLVLMALCAGCSRPATVETFVSSSEVNAAGMYEFPVDFYDSTATYSLSFYARRDISLRRRSDFDASRLIVSWLDPAGQCRLRDTVYMDMGTSRGVLMPYRTGVTVPTWGVWTLQVALSQPGPRFRGLGLTCTLDGTR